MKSIFIFILSLSFVFSRLGVNDKNLQEFESFKKLYGRKYPSDFENDLRFSNFKLNKQAAKLSEHMSKKYGVIDGLLIRSKYINDPLKKCRPEYEQMNMPCIPQSALFSLNEFADLSQDEFISKFSNINEEKIEKIQEKSIPLEIKKNKEIPKEVDWRKKGEIKNKDINKANKIYVLNSSNEDDLKEAVAEKGPIVISLPAEHFRFMTKGIFDYWYPSLCKEDHNILMTVVGYGTYCGIDYWLIKTPFGEQWGDKGCFMLRRGIDTCRVTHFMAWYE